jgi:hypothetical protein
MGEKGTVEILLAFGCLLIATFGMGLMAINLPSGITWGELFAKIRSGKNKKGIAGFFLAWGGMLCFIAVMIRSCCIKG